MSESEAVRESRREVSVVVPLCRVELFGGIVVRPPSGEAVAKFGRKKSAVLLALLLSVHPGKPWNRADLAAYFWTSGTATQKRNALAQCVTDLRRVLGDAVLQTGRDTVTLNVTGVSCDVWGFETALRGATAAPDAPTRALRFAGAVSLYGGDFLRGTDDAGDDAVQWIAELRDSFAARYDDARYALLAAYEAAQQPRHALDLALRLLDEVPGDTVASAAALRLGARIGDGAIAGVLRARTPKPSLPDVAAHLSRVRATGGDVLTEETRAFRAAFAPVWNALAKPLRKRLALIAATHPVDIPVTAASAAAGWQFTKAEAFAQLTAFAERHFLRQQDDEPEHPLRDARRELFYLSPDAHAAIVEQVPGCAGAGAVRAANAHLLTWARNATRTWTPILLAQARAVDKEVVLDVLRRAWEGWLGGDADNAKPSLSDCYLSAISQLLNHGAERHRYIAELKRLFDERERMEPGTRFAVVAPAADRLPDARDRETARTELYALGTNLPPMHRYPVLYESAMRAHHTEDDDRARAFADEAFALVQGSPDFAPTIQSFVNLTEIYAVQGLMNDAHTLYAWAHEHLLTDTTPPFDRSVLLHHEADFLFSQGDFTRADRQFEEAFALTPEVDDHRAVLLRDLAHLYIWMGKYKDATLILREAQSRYRRIGYDRDTPCQSAVIGLLGDIDVCRGDTGAAREKYCHALQVWERENHARWQAIFQTRLAVCAFYDDALDTAHDHFARAEAFIGGTRAPLPNVRLRWWRGRLLTRHGNRDSAFAELNTALAEAERLGLRPYRADILDALADAACESGDTHGANAYRAESDTERAAMGYPRPPIMERPTRAR